jgi:hypothetical protein
MTGSRGLHLEKFSANWRMACGKTARVVLARSKHHQSPASTGWNAMYARTALSVAAAAIVAATAAQGAPFPASGAQSATAIVAVVKKQARRRDCTPYNGPYGFYGNVWCQPPSEESYLRNLSSPWPQETPPALKKVKPDTSTDW